MSGLHMLTGCNSCFFSIRTMKKDKVSSSLMYLFSFFLSLFFLNILFAGTAFLLDDDTIADRIENKKTTMIMMAVSLVFVSLFIRFGLQWKSVELFTTVIMLMAVSIFALFSVEEPMRKLMGDKKSKVVVYLSSAGTALLLLYLMYISRHARVQQAEENVKRAFSSGKKYVQNKAKDALDSQQTIEELRKQNSDLKSKLDNTQTQS